MVVRELTPEDLPALLALQERGDVVGLASVFPQDRYPFPRESIMQRWRDELVDPAVSTYVAVGDDGNLVGFAATTGPELLHFGTAIDTWGDGTAAALLGDIVERLRARHPEPILHVFEDNLRGRRFYEKHGWRPTGTSSLSAFEPRPVLLEYSLPASDPSERPSE